MVLPFWIPTPLKIPNLTVMLSPTFSATLFPTLSRNSMSMIGPRRVSTYGIELMNDDPYTEILTDDALFRIGEVAGTDTTAFVVTPGMSCELNSIGGKSARILLLLMADYDIIESIRVLNPSSTIWKDPVVRRVAA
jgi:hypothetical protein